MRSIRGGFMHGALVTRQSALWVFAVVAVSLGAGTAFAQPADRSGSLGMVSAAGESAAAKLPLQQSTADVNIAGVIGHVRITQVYGNEGTKPLEAIYVFPGATRAAVFGMRMKIGERTIEAKI